MHQQPARQDRDRGRYADGRRHARRRGNSRRSAGRSESRRASVEHHKRLRRDRDEPIPALQEPLTENQPGKARFGGLFSFQRTNMNPGGTRAQDIALLLAGSLCALPFLMPYHEPPVTAFHAEWMAAMLGIAAALAALAAPRLTPVASWPVPARWLAAFALFLALLAVFTRPVYPQLPVVAALYVVFAALMIWLGSQLTRTVGIESVAVTVAGFLVVGSLLTALAGVIQFYGRPKLLEDIVAELHGTRAYGNIAQANLYANYVALGESALVYLWARGRVRTWHALAALSLLVLGSALAQSRATFLY